MTSTERPEPTMVSTGGRLRSGMAGELVDRARALGPTIRKWSDEGDRTGRVADPVMDEFFAAGFYEMLLPRAIGGSQVDPITFVEVVEEIARHDGSVGWVASQTIGGSLISAYLERDAAAEVFGGGRTVVAWGPAIRASAVEHDDGYVLNGEWTFASGIRNANWIGAASAITMPDGSAKARDDDMVRDVRFLVPIDEVERVEAWDVIGLRATGSDSFRIHDVRVPLERAAYWDVASHRHDDGALYRINLTTLYAASFGGVMIGMASAMLDAWIELAGVKTARSRAGTVREYPIAQFQLGVVASRLAAARAFLYSALGDAWDAANDGAIEFEHRAAIRMAGSNAIREAREVAEVIYHAAGSTAILNDKPFERRFRDLHAGSQQMQARDDMFEHIGKYLLGLEPNRNWF